MSMKIAERRAVLGQLIAKRPGIETWTVHFDGQQGEAVVYTDLVGPVAEGDQVLLNTTAVDLQLGTGGQHFVINRIDLGSTVPPMAISRDEGHIMKLRYTPLQLRVRAAEEDASPYHDLLRTAETLPGTPVVCLGLHSQLAPVVGGIKAANPDLRIAYVMTDSAALPLAYSQLVHTLRESGLLDVTVSTGQAFGGDLEAVNIFSALVTASLVGKADIIVAGQGPGNVGTATALGFGGIEQSILLNAAAALDGLPVVVPRISFADPRDRHRGLSHHSATVLRKLTMAEVVLPLPAMTPEQSDLILGQINQHGLVRHRLLTVDGKP
ncbi:MAG TPA: DUF3866 family protein, partial [Armatimonadota bacterium]|nr:DUF3866 family protein [Armatimonadota bacterium]